VTIEAASVHRILVIKLRAVGDVTLSTVVLPNLRKAFTHARIDFLVEKGSSQVLAGNPYIDEVVVFTRGGFNGLTILRELRRRKYDLVFDLFGNPRSAMMTFASGARYRVGYAFRGRTYAYNMIAEPRGALVHNVEFNLDALRRVDIPIIERTTLFPLSDDDIAFAKRVVAGLQPGTRKLVGLNPGTNRPTEKWPAERFAELGRMLHDHYGAVIVVFWGPGERTLAENITAMIGPGAVVAPPTTLKQLGALFTHCDLVVSNDSGPMHIAAAVGAPTVGIFGPVNPRLQGPYGEKTAYVVKEGLSCLGCNLDKHCPIGNICMTELDAAAVFSTASKLISNN
jgi:lipopolysaccharide heptosyltransferase II